MTVAVFVDTLVKRKRKDQCKCKPMFICNIQFTVLKKAKHVQIILC